MKAAVVPQPHSQRSLLSIASSTHGSPWPGAFPTGRLGVVGAALATDAASSSSSSS